MGTLHIQHDGWQQPHDIQLSKALHGNLHTITACKRGDRFIDLSLQYVNFDFGHPAMRRMLRRLNTSEDGSIASVVKDALLELREQCRNAVTS
ncbi:MAG: hypothetical protein PHX87_06455 [Candidatus Peribacteraceae bacterium]|nr:hypothetical protein [Candidatus Peribacteraceae bacterium]MDD5743030.1 hypothetical protein [Candidatus Peribacteraceae bacterium]